MEKEQKRAARIDDQIAVIRADCNAARSEHAELARQLVESPDPKLLEQLEVLESEIAEHDRKVARLEAAKAEAARRDTVEAKRSELERLKAGYARIEERLARQTELAARLVEIAGSFAPLLVELDSLAVDNWADVRAVARGACGGDSDIAERHYMPLDYAAHGQAGRAALINALWASGLGRVGMHLDPFVEVTPAEDKRPVADSTAKATGMLLSKLSELIAQREAQVMGKAAK